jgi:superfamily II DNA or RNA helicase
VNDLLDTNCSVNHFISMALILREYQNEIKSKVYAAWDKGHKNVMLVLPTGSGKTVCFCSIAIDLAIAPIQNKLPTAIAVHRKELVQQISLTLAKEGIVHNIIAPKPTINGIIAAQRKLFNKQFYDYNSIITVISIDTLNARIIQHEKWAKGIRLWICDEAAHLLRNNKWGRAIEYFPDAIGLGVTATPQRLDKRGLGRHADGVFDVMVQGPGCRWLIEEGFLSRYKIAVPQSDYRNYLAKAEGNADYSKEAMALASSQSHIIGDVVTNYIKFASGRQAILFASDIGSGREMEQKFREAGISAKLLTGTTEDKERLNAMIDFRDKRIQVLLNVDLFDEGLDVPGIECVIMARPTMSIGKYLQMIGRGLRPAKGKDHLIVIDHVGNVPEHGLPDSHRKWTLDRIVKRRDRTNLIRICSNWQCNAPFDRVLTECPYCGTPVPKPGAGEGGRIGPEQVDGDLELLDPETLREMYESVVLESPESVAERVAHVAGGPAGKKAHMNQLARIETQKALVEVIALWAGKMRSHHYYSDRQINKSYFLIFDQTITESLGEPKAEMLRTIERVKGELGEYGIGDSTIDSDRSSEIRSDITSQQ